MRDVKRDDSIRVEIDLVSTLDISVDYTLSGTATGGGTDHNLVNGTITISAGDTAIYIYDTIMDDAIYEGAFETMILTLSNPVNAVLGTTTTTRSSRDVPLPGWVGGGTRRTSCGYAVLCNEKERTLGQVVREAFCDAVAGIGVRLC